MLWARYELTLDVSFQNTILVERSDWFIFFICVNYPYKYSIQMSIAYRWRNRTERHNCISESK
jgi:hypothetical protein